MNKSPWQSHCDRWGKGCGSSLCPGAQNVCLARGTVPCDVVFVGEAPGHAENSLGEPFVGPAGQLLDAIIEASVPEGVSYAMTNLVGCIPIGEDGDKVSQPDEDAVEACTPRLVEFITVVAKPRLLVLVGKLAEDYLIGKYRWDIDVGKIPAVAIAHPAYILRCPYVQQGMLKSKSILTIRDAIEEHLGIVP